MTVCHREDDTPLSYALTEHSFLCFTRYVQTWEYISRGASHGTFERTAYSLTGAKQRNCKKTLQLSSSD
jgi:hypothetical protein